MHRRPRFDWSDLAPPHALGHFIRCFVQILCFTDRWQIHLDNRVPACRTDSLNTEPQRMRIAREPERDYFADQMFRVLVKQTLSRRLRFVAAPLGPSAPQLVTRLEPPPARSVHRPRAPAERDLRFAAVSSNDRPSLSRSAFDPV